MHKKYLAQNQSITPSWLGKGMLAQFLVVFSKNIGMFFMQILNSDEVSQINGGIGNFIIGTVIGLVTYAIDKHNQHEPMTLPGAATAAGFGALTGGLGSARLEIAGGGIVANIVWKPGFLAINASKQEIATPY